MTTEPGKRKGATKGVRPKHIPVRTCIGCRQERSKREMVRIVRTPDGKIRVDPTGKLAGRGTYVCRSRACWKLALQGNRLSAALKAAPTPEDMALLEHFEAALPVT